VIPLFCAALDIQNVSVHNIALGDQDGEAEIVLPTLHGQIDYALATLRTVEVSDYENVQMQKVRVAKFDEFDGQIDFNKIDFVKIGRRGIRNACAAGHEATYRITQASYCLSKSNSAITHNISKYSTI
jgi:hypothetical protein